MRKTTKNFSVHCPVNILGVCCTVKWVNASQAYWGLPNVEKGLRRGHANAVNS